jgi:hypothetical protein
MPADRMNDDANVNNRSALTLSPGERAGVRGRVNELLRSISRAKELIL